MSCALNAPEVNIEQPVDPMLVAKYFLARDEERKDSDLTQMKLHKLMYFAQANFLADVGKPLFESRIEAFEHGPVADAIYSQFRDYGRNIIVAQNDALAHNAAEDSMELSEFIRDYLSDVWNYFKGYSASQLRAMSHDDQPWSRHYCEKAFHSLIPDDEIAAWYRTEVPATHRVFVSYVSSVVDEDLEKLDSELDETVIERWRQIA